MPSEDFAGKAWTMTMTTKLLLIKMVMLIMMVS